MNIIKGSGQITAREAEVGSFIYLHFSINGKKDVPVSIELCNSDEEKVMVETDENLIKYFTATNLGKTLFISSEAGLKNIDFTSLKITVYLRQLVKLNICSENYQLTSSNVIAVSSPLDIKIQGTGNANLQLDAPVLKALFRNEGDITLTGICEEADIKTQSEGDLLAKEFLVQTLKIKNYSEGNLEVFADKSISIIHYGEGYVHYYGDARLTHVNQRGDGFIQHKLNKTQVK